MKTIALSRGKFAIVDDADFDVLSETRWHFTTVGYAANRGKGLMHRLLMNPPPGMQVDHINGDKLDNRRANLRICTQQQNLISKSKRKDSKMKFKGVMYVRPSVRSLNERKRPYYAKIRHAGTWYGLGYFATQEEAARAYNVKAKELHGEFAVLNEV